LVGNLAGQTDSLLVLMSDRGAANALVEMAKELLNFFSDTEEQIAALLRAAEIEEPQPFITSAAH
jgi:hypothetical protein